jgi:acetolactate synthase-like protein
MKRHNIPCIGLIGNDAGWTQIEREQVPMFRSPVACVLDYCNYDEVSRGYGGEGLTIRTPEEITSVLQKAQQLARDGRPVVVNALIGKTNFREGSLSV